MLRLLAATAAAYGVSRRLLRDPEPPALPGPAGPLAERAHARLLRLRARAREAIIEGRAERDAAASELQREYLERTGRSERDGR